MPDATVAWAGAVRVAPTIAGTVSAARVPARIFLMRVIDSPRFSIFLSLCAE